jgi:PAS domain S-box-containing protein
MKKKSVAFISLARQFRRNYHAISIIPVMLLFVLVVCGVLATHFFLSELISNSTYELNQDAKKYLSVLGENIIACKSEDVAKQLEIYFRTHPAQSIQEMRNDPLFRKIALQKVGLTGYTALTEANTNICRVHPNPELIDHDLEQLSPQMPTWWAIVKKDGTVGTASGYYDWIEPNGSIREKYMAITPVKVPLNDITMHVAATTYIDEFSRPTVAMREKADSIVRHYSTYMARLLLLFGIISLLVIGLSYFGTLVLGRRAASHYILPIVQLADAVRSYGKGQWDVVVHENILNRNDEIGTLSQAFRDMTKQLKDLFHRLENRLVELKGTRDALIQNEARYKKLYETSKKAEEVYRSLIHSSADAILIFDLKLKLTYTSPMFTILFGWTAEELRDDKIPYIPESEKAAILPILQNIVDTGTPCQAYEAKRTSKDGRLIEVSISASRFDDHEGKPEGILMIMRDISEKKRLEAQLQHIERMEAIGTLAGGIAHDFNNLLMAIQGNISLMRYDLAPSHPGYKSFLVIEKQIESGARLTSQLLGYARKGKYEVRPLDINEILLESAETFQRTRKDISIHHDLSPGLHPVEADFHQIEQVLMNLFINASDAMNGCGDLYIKTRNTSSASMINKTYAPKSGEYISVVIHDSGIGMDQKTIARIFDPFFTTKEMGRGTGLGLASVYGIVKGHSGYIDVDSEEGRGTTFSIYLPATRRKAEQKPEIKNNAVKGQGTILLVDDELQVLDVGAKMLKMLGYTILTADSGRSALKAVTANKGHIDMVILDMVMPDISGGHAFEQIKEIDPDVNVLLSSGYNIDGKATEIMDQGCDGFIQKPYTIEKLSKKLKEIMKANK